MGCTRHMGASGSTLLLLTTGITVIRYVFFLQVLDTALHFTYMTIFILALQTNSIAVSVAISNQNNGTANGTAEAEAVIVCRNMEEGTLLGRTMRKLNDNAIAQPDSL